MTTFAPINDDHAVTWVKFGLHLDEPIEQMTIEAARRAGDWLEDLPAVTNLPGVRVPTGIGMIEVPAVQFAIVRPDGSPLWALRLSGQLIEVECSTYTRWDIVWAQAKAYLSAAWKLVREEQDEVNIIDFNLEVDDKFTSEVEDYIIRDVFRDSEYFNISPIFSSGIWQSRAGWVEAFPDISVVHTLTMQCSGVYEGRDFRAPYGVSVRHLVNVVRKGNNESDLSDNDEVASYIDQAADLAHARNKAVLSALLEPRMAERIGLQP